METQKLLNLKSYHPWERRFLQDVKEDVGKSSAYLLFESCFPSKTFCLWWLVDVTVNESSSFVNPNDLRGPLSLDMIWVIQKVINCFWCSNNSPSHRNSDFSIWSHWRHLQIRHSHLELQWQWQQRHWPHRHCHAWTIVSWICCTLFTKHECWNCSRWCCRCCTDHSSTCCYWRHHRWSKKETDFRFFILLVRSFSIVLASHMKNKLRHIAFFSFAISITIWRILLEWLNYIMLEKA